MDLPSAVNPLLDEVEEWAYVDTDSGRYLLVSPPTNISFPFERIDDVRVSLVLTLSGCYLSFRMTTDKREVFSFSVPLFSEAGRFLLDEKRLALDLGERVLLLDLSKSEYLSGYLDGVSNTFSKVFTALNRMMPQIWEEVWKKN